VTSFLASGMRGEQPRIRCPQHQDTTLPPQRLSRRPASCPARHRRPRRGAARPTPLLAALCGPAHAQREMHVEQQEQGGAGVGRSAGR
jgi:hypothetical protein